MARKFFRSCQSQPSSPMLEELGLLLEAAPDVLHVCGWLPSLLEPLGELPLMAA